MNEFFGVAFWCQLTTSLIGTLAFAVLFRVRPTHLPYAGACGTIAFLLYYTVAFFGGSPFVAAFVSVGVGAALSEWCARHRRAPSPVFLVPASIPIVPGSDLYYTMRYLLAGELPVCAAHLVRALLIGLGMAGGIVTVSMLINLVRSVLQNQKKQ